MDPEPEIRDALQFEDYGTAPYHARNPGECNARTTACDAAAQQKAGEQASHSQ